MMRDECDMSGSLEIFKEFNEVYKERLKDAESAGGDAILLKLKTLEDWVSDLTEQNTVLVETVKALEKEALSRQGIGMDRKPSSFEGNDCKACKSRRAGSLGIGGKGLVSHSSDELHSRDQFRDTLLCYKSINNVKRREQENVENSVQFQETQEKLRQSDKEIEKLRVALANNETKLSKINEDIAASEKSAREMRAALTAEVAEKHDQVLALRREVQHLEDKLRQADMQTHFKDDIIKELRKEIKIANNKLNFLGVPVTSSNLHKSYPHPYPEIKEFGNDVPTQNIVTGPHYSATNMGVANIECTKTNFCNSDNVRMLPHRSSELEFVSESHNVLRNNMVERDCLIGKDSKALRRIPKRTKKLTKQTVLHSIEEKCNNFVEDSCGDYLDNKM